MARPLGGPLPVRGCRQQDRDPTGGDVITFWLRGTGDYAGLSYYYRVTGSGPWQFTGYIYPGDLPAPSLAAAAAE